MDTYLNVYKGYYVSIRVPTVLLKLLTTRSSLVMELVVTTRVSTGSEDE